MHFHQLRQDLADFCMELWTEAGRSLRDYSDRDVEFGESRYSGMAVGHLIEDALDCDLASEILYVVNAKGSDKEALSVFLTIPTHGSFVPGGAYYFP